MERISQLEKQYAMEALDNQFRTSLNSTFNSRVEGTFSELMGVKYAIGHVNGTATLHTALAALGVGEGDEVIVPPLTMSSTALAVLQVRAAPVFADVDRETFNIDADSIRARITAKTRAIITVALYGLCPDYDAILEICNQHNIYLIEDNAQCFLGTYKGKTAGQFGDFASYSFQASKQLTSGEGGMLTTGSETLADNARRFSSLGYANVSAKKGKITKSDIQDPSFSRHVTTGFNYRMSEIDAAVLLGQLERADQLVEQRIKAARLFDQAVTGTPLLQKQTEPEGYKHVYWAYSVILKTDTPETDWYAFRDLFQKNGGHGYYAAWKLSYMEPLFLNDKHGITGVTQKYEKGLCPTAEYLQPRMIQFKTNYYDLAEAENQTGILAKTIKEFGG
ncbi:MAG: DegT/DnrJ/EryC1/StrS family aminotransferase [bacterium]|nr:DegT/DnrJ/EryC1/StrS family aminotransferase [bacterium]